ncbi:MAG: AsmA family protein, partial [Geminicoccaceae bacterium]
MLRRIGAIALGLLLLVVVLAGGALAWVVFFPDTLKPTIERYASAKLGREVRIGLLSIEPGRVTTVELRGLRIAAPEWARADDLLTIARLRVGADLVAYLQRRAVRLPEITVEQPVLALERDAQGRTSWPSAGGGRASSPGPRLELGRVTVEGGRVAYSDVPREVDFQADIATEAGPEGAVHIAGDGKGTAKGQPLTASLRVGGLREAAGGAGPVDVDGHLSLAGAEIGLTGQVQDPAALAGIRLALSMNADKPADTMALLGQPQPGPLPSLAAAATVTGNANVYGLDDIQVQWGESDLAGQLRLDLSQAQPTLDGTLRSKLLDFAAFNSDAEAQPAKPSGDWGNPLRPLAGYAGRLTLQADEIRLPTGPILRDSAVTLALDQGRLTVAPIRIGLPDGEIAGEIATGPLDADRLTVEPKLKASGVDLASLAGDGYDGRVDADLAGSILLAPPEVSLATSRLQLTGSVKDLAIPQARLGTISAKAQVADGHLRVDELDADLPQGKVRGNLTAGPFDRNFLADVDLDMSGVDLAAIARVEGVTGRLDGKLSGTVRGSQPLDVLTRSTLQLKGTVSDLRLPRIERRIGRAEIDASLDPDRREALKLVASAAAGDRTLSLSAFGGSSGTLAENRGDYPFTIVSELDKNELKVNGTVSLPLTERRFAATIEAKGPDPSPILALFDLPKLQIPPYRLAGVFTNHGDELKIKDFDGK